MAEPVTAQRGPYEVEVTAGRTYWWCACGRSRAQPFCDGSHKGSEFTPVKYTAGTSGPAWFCGCKRTGDRPMCDGTHGTL